MISSLPTIAKAAEQIRAGEISPLDLVEHCLSRIEQYEDRIRAWVLVDADGARKQAERCVALRESGIALHPLAGIPIGIKDIIDVAGWPTRAGSPLREGHIAKVDAPLVHHLRGAGAILLGKTVTTQFASFDPPPTRNPWNLNHTPGGSSSGSAAAVAMEMCMAAIGSQTGGSIIRPASYCGVAGLKPTIGHISLDGIVPLSEHLDHAGPIARCADDLAVVYAVATGFDQYLAGVSRGTKSAEAMLAGLPDSAKSVASLAEHLSASPSSISLAMIEDYFLEHASRDVQSITRRVLAGLQDGRGAEQSLQLPASFADVHSHHYRIMAYGAAEYHRKNYSASRSAYAPNIAKLIEDGLATPREEYLATLAHQRCFQADIDALLSDGTIAVMPSTSTTAPGIDTTGDPNFNSPWSYAGVPAVTIPCGLASDGLPCGLQLVGSRNSEPRLLQVAAWCERRIGFQDRPAAS